MFLFCHTQYKHYAYISCHVSDVFRMHFLLKHSTEMMNEVVSVSHKVWNTYNNLPVICKTLFFYNYSSFEKILFCIFIIIKYCKNSTMNNKNNLLTACVHLKHFTLGAVPLNSCALKYKREVSNSTSTLHSSKNSQKRTHQIAEKNTTHRKIPSFQYWILLTIQTTTIQCKLF